MDSMIINEKSNIWKISFKKFTKFSRDKCKFNENFIILFHSWILCLIHRKKSLFYDKLIMFWEPAVFMHAKIVPNDFITNG